MSGAGRNFYDEALECDILSNLSQAGFENLPEFLTPFERLAPPDKNMERAVV